MNLQHVVDRLAAAGLGVPGVTLFRERMPMAVAEGLLVCELQPNTINPYVMGLKRGTFAVVARGSELDAIRARLQSATAELTVQGWIVDSTHYRHVTPRHDPFIYPRSDGDLYEGNVLFDYVFSTL